MSSQRAPSVFVVDILRSTGAMSFPSSSCFWTCVAYQSQNLLHINSFTDLFTFRSIGCKRSVQLPGTVTTWLLLSSKILAMSNVCWPLKTLKITTESRFHVKTFLLELKLIWSMLICFQHISTLPNKDLTTNGSPHRHKEVIENQE